MGKRKTEKEKSFDKYKYYLNSVQAPDTDVIFLRDTYKELKGKMPKTLGEDFCGTHAICCEWVKLNPHFEAYGVDLDPEPIQYGQENYASKLSSQERARVNVQEANVLDPNLPHVDVIAGMNFSYFLFKKRSDLKAYFANAYSRLNKGGVFILDCFGGSACQAANEEETEYDNFSYYWDQDSYNPVNNHAQFYIHFKPKGKKKIKECFAYDWRMWSIAEIREILDEVGFKKSHVYWEGTTDDGEGDGNFTRTEMGEECESWIAYIASEK